MIDSRVKGERFIRIEGKLYLVPGVVTGPPFLGGYKYGDLVLQFGGVSNLRR
jgi:hypothetical protein